MQAWKQWLWEGGTPNPKATEKHKGYEIQRDELYPIRLHAKVLEVIWDPNDMGYHLPHIHFQQLLTSYITVVHTYRGYIISKWPITVDVTLD